MGNIFPWHVTGSGGVFNLRAQFFAIACATCNAITGGIIAAGITAGVVLTWKVLG